MQADATSLLHAALVEGNDRAVRFLLKHGADPNARSRPSGAGLRPFQRLGCDLGARLSRRRSSSLVLRPAKPMVPLSSCGSATLQHRVAAGSCGHGLTWNTSLVEVARPTDPTPLHVAAATGSSELAELLLDAGAQVEARMEGEYTPLAVAILGRRLHVTRLLLSRGASVGAAARRGKQPLHLAARARRPDFARLLLEHGADPNARTQHGVTPLHVAVERGLVNTVELLLGGGADVNAKTDTGVTPLHCAAVKGRRRITEMILNRGADVSVIVRKGEIDVTPLLWVTEEERRKTTEVLAKYVDKSISPAEYYGRFFKKIWKHLSGKN